MSALYSWLLYLYPSDFRRKFGEEMSSVFADVRAQSTRRGVFRQVAFVVREIAGLVRGALQEQVRSLSGLDFGSRRINMSPNRFRFPWSSIALMAVSLALVVTAIHKAQEVAESFTGNQLRAYQPDQIPIFPTFGLVFGATVVCAVVIWAVLHKMHRSGVHRLSDAQTWPQQQ